MTRAMKAAFLAALLMAAPRTGVLGAEMPAAVERRTPATEEAGTLGPLDPVEREELRLSDPARLGSGEAESSLLIVSAAVLIIIALLLV